MSTPNPPRQTATATQTESGEQSAFVAVSVREALLGLKNGQITITVHNGEIIQIDRVFRKRQFKSRPRP